MTVKRLFERYEGTLDLRSEPAVHLTIDAESLDTKQKSATNTGAPPTSSTSSDTPKSSSSPTAPRSTATASKRTGSYTPPENDPVRA
jgi:hypothetical protein